MKKQIKLKESDLRNLVKNTVRNIINENFMSDSEIESQYTDYNIASFNIKPLRNSEEGFSGYFELEFPNANGVDFDDYVVNGFIVYDNKGERIAWDRWMPNDVTNKLENIIRNKIQKSVSLNEGESGGWVVEPDEAEEAYKMFAMELGTEEANAAIVRALGSQALSDVLAYLFRMYDFREWDNRKGVE